MASPPFNVGKIIIIDRNYDGCRISNLSYFGSKTCHYLSQAKTTSYYMLIGQHISPNLSKTDHILTEIKNSGGGEPMGISVSCSLVRNKFQVLISKCSRECFWRPPVEHIQVHLPRFPLHTVALMVPPGQGCMLSPAHCGNPPGTAGRNTFDIHCWHLSSLQHRRLRPASSAQQPRELHSQAGLLKPPPTNSPKHDPHDV